MKKYLVICLLLAATAAWSEKIRLKDGGVVRGKIVSETATEIVIANEYGNITIEKKNIAKRVREKTDIPTFNNSEYSFKKRSWPKYAFFGSTAVGLAATAFLADQGYALVAGLSTGGVALIFASLDYFRYGRIPKRIRRRFSYMPPPVHSPYSFYAYQQTTALPGPYHRPAYQPLRLSFTYSM